MPNCPFCGSEAIVARNGRIDLIRVNCGNCGKLQVDELFLAEVQERLANDRRVRPRLRHWLQKRPEQQGRLVNLSRELFERIISQPLPAPREQADNLIRWIGDQLRDDPGRTVRIPLDSVAATIGAFSTDSLFYVMRAVGDARLLYPEAGTPSEAFGLTFLGWDRYDELQKSHSEGSNAQSLDDAVAVARERMHRATYSLPKGHPDGDLPQRLCVKLERVDGRSA